MPSETHKIHQHHSAAALRMQGGLLVIKPSGRIAYHYIAQVMGDLPPERDGYEVGQHNRQD